ncbi:MAG: RDD family protein [Deltaproteobacteria bacterium]|nr:MAG: RDD family protein [Deltaproteobacteria bacterium]
MIDLLLLSALLVGLSVAALLLGLTLGGIGLAVYFVGSFLVSWGYFTVTEWILSGQTIGKRLLGLRTLHETGVRIDFFQSLIRNLLRILDMLPATYLVGGLVALASTRRRRLGDLLAGTLVVQEDRQPPPEAILPPGPAYNSVREDPKARAVARRRVDPALRELLLSLALRREELALPTRLLLFSRLAERLATLGIPRPPVLSDERFVLAVTAAIVDPSPGAAASSPRHRITPNKAGMAR